MGLLDLLLAVWVTWWARRGARRGLPSELPRTLGVFIFGVTGFGLFHWTSAVLVQASRLTGQTTTGIGFLALLIGAKLLVRHFRERIRQSAEAHWGQAPFWGSLTGGVRAFMLACIILAFFAEGPLQAVTRPLARRSLVGKILVWSLVPSERRDH